MKNIILFILWFTVLVIAGSPLHGQVDKLLQQADSAIQKSADSSLISTFYLEALDQAKNSNQQIEIYYNRAGYFYNKGMFKESYTDYNETLKIAEQIKSTSYMAKALEGLAHIEWRVGDNVNSLAHILSSIKGYEQTNDTTGIISSSNILGGIYLSNQNIEEAEKIYSDMVDLSVKANDSTNLAYTYDHLGVCEFFKGDYLKAIEYYNKSIFINRNLKDQIALGINYINLAESYEYLEKYDSAKSFYSEGINKLEKNEFYSALIFANYGLGRCLIKMGDNEKGYSHYNQSLELIDQTGEIREKPFVLELMAEYLSENNRSDEAYNIYKEMTALKDSLYNLSKNQQMEVIRAGYELEKKEANNQLLASQNENKNKIIYYQLIVLVVLVASLILLIIVYSKSQKRKKLLTKANKTKEQLLNILGHDLKGPVGNLKAITDLIVENDSVSKDPEIKNVLSSVKDAINNTFHLLNDLLSWTNLQREGISIIKEKLNIHEEVNYVIALIKYDAEQKNILVLNNTLKEEFVHADKQAFHGILRNLIGNAIKFTLPNGEIKINSESHDEDVIVHVTDNGIGVSEHVGANIFKTSKRKTTSGTQNEKGTGLGLILCKEFVELSGGEIWFESEKEKGSTFSFSLPKN